MVRSNASPAPYSEEVDDMHTDERIPKLVSDVAHLQSDVSDIKVETRALRNDVGNLRDDMHAGFAKVREEMQAQGKELRAEIAGLRTDLRAEIAGVRTELRAEIAGVRTDMQEQGTSLRASIDRLTLELERFKGRQWVAIAVLYVLVALCMGGLPSVLARTLKLPW